MALGGAGGGGALREAGRSIRRAWRSLGEHWERLGEHWERLGPLCSNSFRPEPEKTLMKTPSGPLSSSWSTSVP